MDGVPKFGSKGSKGSLTLIQSRGIDIHVIITRGRESGVMIMLTCSFGFNKEISYGRRRFFSLAKETKLLICLQTKMQDCDLRSVKFAYSVHATFCKMYIFEKVQDQ